MNKFFPLFTLFTLFTLVTFSHSQEVGGYAGDVWNYSTGARSYGLGQAMVSVAEDSSAGYWNPSRLGLIRTTHFGLLRTSLIEGAQYDYLGFAYPSLTKGVFGTSLIRLGIDGVERRDASNNLLGNYGFSVTGYSLSWGYQFSQRVYLGSSAKRLDRRLADYKSSLTSVDAGANFSLMKKMDASLVMRDLFFTGSGTSDRLPQNLIVGANYRFFNNALRLALQVEQMGFVIRSGIEYNMGPTFLRLGVGESFTGGGFGLRFRGMSLDYALSTNPYFGNTSRLSFGFAFGRDAIREREIRTRRYANEAQEAYRKGQFVKAEKFFKKALEFTPRDVILLEKLSLVRAIRELLQTERKKAETPREASDQDKLYYATLQANLAEYVEAKTEEGGASYKLARAETSLLQGQLGLALRYCQEAVMMDPNNPLTHERLGSVYFALGFKKEALKSWRQSLGFNPANETLKEFLRIQELE